MALAPLFESVRAVEINRTLAQAAEDNLTANNITRLGCSRGVLHLPSSSNVSRGTRAVLAVLACIRMLRNAKLFRMSSESIDESIFAGCDVILVDPPRSGRRTPG